MVSYKKKKKLRGLILDFSLTIIKSTHTLKMCLFGGKIE